MRRPDLKDSNSGKYAGAGWQAIDATQQELSFGVNQLGPAPLAAVKDLGGEQYHNRWNPTSDKAAAAKYDTCFVIAEANYFIANPNNWNNWSYDSKPSRATDYTTSRQPIGVYNPSASRVSTSAVGASKDSKYDGEFDPTQMSEITYLYKKDASNPKEHDIRMFSAAPTLDIAHSLFKHKVCFVNLFLIPSAQYLNHFCKIFLFSILRILSAQLAYLLYKSMVLINCSYGGS